MRSPTKGLFADCKACAQRVCHDKRPRWIDGGEDFRKWRGNVFTTDPRTAPRPETPRATKRATS